MAEGERRDLGTRNTDLGNFCGCLVVQKIPGAAAVARYTGVENVDRSRCTVLLSGEHARMQKSWMKSEASVGEVCLPECACAHARVRDLVYKRGCGEPHRSGMKVGGRSAVRAKGTRGSR